METITKVLEKHQLEYDKLNDDIKMNEKLKCLPLHQFSNNDICHTIKLWVYNDVNYNKYLLKTMQILSQCSLSGKSISEQPLKNIQRILEKELLTFMTYKTFNIMFRNLQKYKNEQLESIQSKTPQEIGYILYNYPLNNLLDRINGINDNNDIINGTKYIQYYKKNKRWIEKATGWDKEDIYQIHAVLFRNNTFTQQQIERNIENIKSLSLFIPDFKNIIIPKFNVEQLHYKIKNGEPITDFSDTIVNMVHDLIVQNKEKIYESIAECFMAKQLNDYYNTRYNNMLSSTYARLTPLNNHKNWVCSNCANFNHIQLIESRMSTKVSICSLCGIKQMDSIIIQLKACDTYTMVNNNQNNNNNINHTKDIDILIQSVQKNNSFNLKCVNNIDNKPCPAILRLAKYLIIYQRWINNIYSNNNSIENTVNVYPETNISNDVFKNIFIECAKLAPYIDENSVIVLVKMLDNNEDNMNDIKKFVRLARAEWSKLLEKHTKIKPAFGSKLYGMIMNKLNNISQEKQFGEYLSIDMNIIDKDYHHILNIHLNNENKDMIENIFKFFGHVVHLEDKKNGLEECICIKRKERNINFEYDNREREDKNIWLMNQNYMQCKLDIIHTHLVHSNDEIEMKEMEKQIKYVTDSAETNANNIFGIDHSHEHLNGKYLCIRNEMLNNELCSLTKTQFDNLLVQAIKAYKIANESGEYKKSLVCKYFQWEFNIIRNTPIGVKNILSLIIYTNVSKLCALFRSTYIKNNNETQDELIERHKQLYHYARALFESVEFFGHYMEPTLNVYHILINKEMQFNKFEIYFHRPISTTASITTAQKFSNGNGVILALRSGNTKVAKYVPISWLSNSPHTSEKLFYGENVHFQIYDIVEASNGKSHLKELSMLQKFQDMVHNREVYWDINDNKMIDGLVAVIQNQQEMNEMKDIDNKDDSKDTEYITDYGKELFNHFCNNMNTTNISIKDYNSLPSKLLNALFGSKNKNKLKYAISLIPITYVFKNMTDITLNDLNIRQLKNNLNVVLEYVNIYNTEDNHTFANLKQIKFQTKICEKRKENSTLKKLQMKYFPAFSNLNWSIVYYFDVNESIHSLMFVNKTAVVEAANNASNRSLTKWKNDYKTSAQSQNKLERLDITVISDDIHAKYAQYEDVQSPEFSASLVSFKFSDSIPGAQNTLNTPNTPNTPNSPRKIKSPRIQPKTSLSLNDEKIKLKSIWNKIPLYFMQIININKDLFSIHLSTSKVDKMQRRLRIININDESIANKSVTIDGQQHYVTTDIEIIQEYDKIYELAIFEPKNTDDIIPNTNQLHFNILKNINNNYKPNSIDCTTLIKVKDEINNQINIYWNTPTLLFGNISYKIIRNNSDNNKSNDIITLLPYIIPISMIPISFSVITITTINENKYESEISENIFIGNKGVYIKNTFDEAYQNDDQNIIDLYNNNENDNNIINVEIEEDNIDDDDIKYDDNNLNSSDSELDDNNDEIEEKNRQLLEGFLDMKDPEITYPMVDFLSKDNITHILLSYLSRLPKGTKIWENKYEINFAEIIVDTPNNLSSDNENEIRATQLSYSVMRILSNIHETETIESFLIKKCPEICLHSLAIFLPLSSGNKYHGRVVLELLFYNDPKQFINTLINNKNIQSLVKCALFRNIHQGNLDSFILDLISFGSNNVKKLIKMLIDMKFIEYILSIACDSKQFDSVATKYGNFFIDLIIRSASSVECSELFAEYSNNNNYLIIDSFMNGLLNNNYSVWHRINCGQILIQFLDILSREDIIENETQNSNKNILHSQFEYQLNRTHSFIPKLCNIIINPNFKINTIKLSCGDIIKPFGQIRFHCLSLLVVSTDFAQYKCGKVLSLMQFENNKFWKILLNMVFELNYNNMFLSFFRRLIHLSMIFRRRILKYLCVNCKMLERMMEFYKKNTYNNRTELHSYILQITYDIYNYDKNNDGIDDDDEDSKTNYSIEDEDQWDIVQFFDSNTDWKSFYNIVNEEIQIQNDEYENDNIENNNNNNNNDKLQLDQLLENLLNDLHDNDSDSDSDSDSDNDNSDSY